MESLKKYNYIELYKLIEKSEKNLSKAELYSFFNNLIFENIKFKDIFFSKEDVEVLENFTFFKNTCVNCVFDISYKEATIKKGIKGIFSSGVQHENCALSSFSFNNPIFKVPNTNYTCFTSVYIKLGTMCNASCAFCKNKTEEEKGYNIDNIIQTLMNNKVFSFLNQIYFGGGEPTLKLEDVETLLKKIQMMNKRFLKWYLFTNGSGDFERLNFLIKNYHNGQIILSRQAIEEEKNQKIMGINYSLEEEYIKRLFNENHIALSLTINEENEHAELLEEYLRFGNSLNCHNYIIQTLEHKSINNFENNINLISILKEQLEKEEYQKSEIVSTSYFKLYLYRNFLEKKRIALKEYFNSEQLQDYWNKSSKHSFDLGIDSDGQLYQDFQMIKRL